MKKLIAIVCTLIMCLGLMTACGERIDDSSNANNNEPKGITLVYGDTKIDLTVGQWEAKRTQIKTADVSLGTSKEYEFTGVTLAALMEMAGATDCTKILVKSSDGWSAEVAAEDAKSYSIMITDGYVGGKEIPADAGGPVKMVFPATEHPELNDKYDTWAWQWYAAEVEFVK